MEETNTLYTLNLNLSAYKKAVDKLTQLIEAQELKIKTEANKTGWENIGKLCIATDNSYNINKTTGKTNDYPAGTCNTKPIPCKIISFPYEREYTSPATYGIKKQIFIDIMDEKGNVYSVLNRLEFW